MKYDVVIAGASFASLAVANQLRGKRVLLLDRKSVGAGQTSACGTLLSVVEHLGLQDSLLQIHDRIILHTPHQTITYPLPYRFCTVDYGRFCRLLFERSGADFAGDGGVQGHLGQQALSHGRSYTGRHLVDATGWRAALSRSPEAAIAPTRSKRVSFGIETELPQPEEGLHFWYDPKGILPRGIAWLFPCGSHSRFGVGSYEGRTRLKSTLDHWLRRDFQLDPEQAMHGGYFTHYPTAAVVDGIYRVGDSAGHCLPVTGEGIRQALYFGTVAGRLINQVLEGTLRHDEALRLYEVFVRAHRRYYTALYLAQKVLTSIPLRLAEGTIRLVRVQSVLDPIMRVYWRAFNPEILGDIEHTHQRIQDLANPRRAAAV